MAAPKGSFENPWVVGCDDKKRYETMEEAGRAAASVGAKKLFIPANCTNCQGVHLKATQCFLVSPARAVQLMLDDLKGMTDKAGLSNDGT